MAIKDDDLGSAIASAAITFGGVVAVYLFGSHAAGRAHRESDVDIGVLLDRHMYSTPAHDSMSACG